MCKLTVSINKLNIRSLKVTARIRQNRSRMPSQTWSAGGYCKNTSEAVRTPTDSPNVTERQDPNAGSPVNREEGGLHHQVKAKVQHKENVIIGLDKESLGRFPLFSALQEKNKKQQHKPKFCPVKPRGASDWFLWFELVGRQRWSYYNRTDWFFFYKLNLYPRCT